MKLFIVRNERDFEDIFVVGVCGSREDAIALCRDCYEEFEKRTGKSGYDADRANYMLKDFRESLTIETALLGVKLKERAVKVSYQELLDR